MRRRRDQRIIKIIESLQRQHGVLLDLQQKSRRCDVKTVLNAFASFGKKIHKDDEEKLYQRADILSEIFDDEGRGFDEIESNEKVLRALIKEGGLKARELVADNKADALHKLYKALDSWPVILCVSNAKHWVLARSARSRGPMKTITIIDPQRTIKNLIYGGTRDVPEDEFLKWWLHREAPKNKDFGIKDIYYGIIVSK